MLIELFGRNFGPFRDEFHLSLLAADIEPGSDRGVIEVPVEGDEEPLRLLRCAAIYGPNASGKSTILRAASALGYLLGMSAQFPSDFPLGPYEPFLLDDQTADAPVMLGARAVVDRRVYEYQIEFDQRRFLSERLTDRTSDTELFSRAPRVTGAWTEDEQFQLIQAAFRPNALLLSLADAVAPRLAGKLATSFRRVLSFYDLSFAGLPYSAAAERAFSDEAFRSWLVDWLRDADTGVVELDVQPVTPSEPRGGAQRAMRSMERPQYLLTLSHAASAGTTVPLRYDRESMGTRKLTDLAPIIHDLARDGEPRASFVDEIGASVHPLLLLEIIRHVNCAAPAASIRGQLVFASHETALFEGPAEDAVLRRDQVYFTKKSSHGSSTLYSLAEFRERQVVNLRKRYLQGRYGAIPALGRLGG